MTNTINDDRSNMRNQSKYISIIMCVLMMVIVVCGVMGTSMEVYANSNIPNITVTLQPGDGSGDDVTLNSTDNYYGESYNGAGVVNGQFYMSNSQLWFRFPDCPGTFSAPGDGQIFVGWKIMGKGVNLIAGDQYQISSDLSLTAQWAEAGNANLLSLTPSSGTLDPAFDPDCIIYHLSVFYTGSPVSVTIQGIPQDPDATVSYQLSTSLNYNDTCPPMTGHNCLLYIKVTNGANEKTYSVRMSIIYTLTLTTDGEGTAKTTDNLYSGPQNSRMDLSPIPADGWKFKEWQIVSGEGRLDYPSYTNCSYFFGSDNAVVKAVFEKLPTYEVTVNNGTGGGNYVAGASVTITADTPQSGKHFKEWSATGIALNDEQKTATNFTFTMPETAVTLTAKYEIIPATTYSVAVNKGTGMTKTEDSGAASQTDITETMTVVVYTADDGYYFPTDYSVSSVNGISVVRNSYSKITVSGTPTADTTITLPDATAKTTPNKPTTPTVKECTTPANNNGKIFGVTTAMEYKKSEDSAWIAINGSEITGLVPGTYYIRLKATDTTHASANMELTIEEYVNPNQGNDAPAQTTYTITFNPNGGTVSPTSKVTGNNGILASLPTPSRSGYNFNGWFTLASGGTKVTISTVFTSNDMVYAHWERVSSNPSNKTNPAPVYTNDRTDNTSSDTTNDEGVEDYFDELRTDLSAAVKRGGKQTVFWNKGTSLPYDIMRTLQDNSNLTLNFKYKYMGISYDVTIPGRAVKTNVNVKWYGPINLYGTYRRYSATTSNPTIEQTKQQISGTYTVKKGDSLSRIARRFNTSVQHLVDVNNIPDKNRIRAGQVIRY